MLNVALLQSKVSTIMFLLLAVAALSVRTQGQKRTAPEVGGATVKGLPDDWTHHYLVFSDPGSEAQAIAKGRQGEWQRIVNDPRYVVHQLKRHAPTQGPLGNYVSVINEIARERADALNKRGAGNDFGFMRGRNRRNSSANIHSDWQMNLGFNAHQEVGMFPAKYSFSTTSQGQCGSSSSPDFVVYRTGLAGSTKQANILAYDNIYSGCSGAVPSVYWSYNTGPDFATTSPVISLDGTKVAYIESPEVGGGAAILRVLRWKAGQGTDYNSPAPPDNSFSNATAGTSGNTAWSACPTNTSCLISVPFQSPAQNADLKSSPYYDYGSDTLWVGDTSGYVHEFTGVFNGTPAEVVNSGWPVNLTACGEFLGSPVYDQIHQLIFIGNFCGTLSAIDLSGNITNSAKIGFAGPDISDTPLVDPVAGTVYLDVAQDANGNAGVFQFPYNFASNSSGTEAVLGAGSTGSNYVFSGSFDNAYFSSSDSSAPSGNLWVCGNPGGDPTLYAVSITSGALGTVTTGPDLSSGTGAVCSPLTEFCVDGATACSSGGGTDYVFVSPQTEPATGQIVGCTASEGCVISYAVSGTTATLSGAGGFPGGASGIIVDTQDVTTAGTMQIYFELLNNGTSCAGNGAGEGSGTGACAIQAPMTQP